MTLLPALLLAISQNAGTAPPPAAPPPPPPKALPGEIRMEGAREPLSAVRTAVRAEAQRLYGRDCGKVVIPDRAFIPVEITGANNPEYAVLFGRAQCTKWGGTSQRWSGTGGPVVQFWFASDGAARMLLERAMHGFTPTGDGLRSSQHGTYCPGGAGPNPCLVTYRWNEKDRALEVTKRTFVDGTKVRRIPRLRYDYGFLSR